MSVLERLRGGLIVSVQAWPGSAIDDPYVLAALALAAQRNGAVGIRAQGVEHLQAIRARVEVPLIGLIKRNYPGYEPYITPTELEIDAVLGAGAEVVAFDATARPRPGGASVADAIARIHAAGALAMADCADLADAERARGAGADILAGTLCGYTDATQDTPLPALGLVRGLRDLGAFAVCEGGVHTPEMLAAAFAAGADAVVVGTAICNVDWQVRRFAAAATRQNQPPR